MRGARGASRDHLLGSDGHAHDGDARGGGGLQDAVQVVQVIAIGRDVLLGEGEDLGHLAGDARHDVHEVVGDGQDVTLHDRRRDGDAVQVDDAVALRGVDGDDGVHALVDLHAVHGLHVDGGVHEGDGLVGQRRGIGADVGGHDDVALEHVAVLVHLDELERRGEGCDRAVAVGHGADHLGAGAQAAEAADDAERGGAAAGRLAVRAGDEDLDAVRAAALAAHALDGDVRGAVGAQEVGNLVAGGLGLVDEVIDIEHLTQKHGGSLSFGRIGLACPAIET